MIFLSYKYVMWIVLFWTPSKTGMWHANAVKDNELMKGLDHLTEFVQPGEENLHGGLIDMYKYFMCGD